MEKVLAYNLNQAKLTSLYKICSQLKVAVIEVQQSEMLTPIEQLLDNRPFRGTAKQESETAVSLNFMGGTDSLVLMCELTDKHMDKLLAALRLGNISIDFKAMLTPTNKKWNGMRLLAEMAAEKQAIEGSR